MDLNKLSALHGVSARCWIVRDSDRPKPYLDDVLSESTLGRVEKSEKGSVYISHLEALDDAFSRLSKKTGTLKAAGEIQRSAITGFITVLDEAAEPLIQDLGGDLFSFSDTAAGQLWNDIGTLAGQFLAFDGNQATVANLEQAVAQAVAILTESHPQNAQSLHASWLRLKDATRRAVTEVPQEQSQLELETTKSVSSDTSTIDTMLESVRAVRDYYASQNARVPASATRLLTMLERYQKLGGVISSSLALQSDATDLARSLNSQKQYELGTKVTDAMRQVVNTVRKSIHSNIDSAIRSSESLSYDDILGLRDLQRTVRRVDITKKDASADLAKLIGQVAEYKALHPEDLALGTTLDAVMTQLMDLAMGQAVVPGVDAPKKEEPVQIPQTPQDPNATPEQFQVKASATLTPTPIAKAEPPAQSSIPINDQGLPEEPEETPEPPKPEPVSTPIDAMLSALEGHSGDAIDTLRGYIIGVVQPLASNVGKEQLTRLKHLSMAAESSLKAKGNEVEALKLRLSLETLAANPNPTPSDDTVQKEASPVDTISKLSNELKGYMGFLASRQDPISTATFEAGKKLQATVSIAAKDPSPPNVANLKTSAQVFVDALKAMGAPKSAKTVADLANGVNNQPKLAPPQSTTPQTNDPSQRQIDSVKTTLSNVHSNRQTGKGLQKDIGGVKPYGRSAFLRLRDLVDQLEQSKPTGQGASLLAEAKKLLDAYRQDWAPENLVGDVDGAVAVAESVTDEGLTTEEHTIATERILPTLKEIRNQVNGNAVNRTQPSLFDHTTETTTLDSLLQGVEKAVGVSGLTCRVARPSIRKKLIPAGGQSAFSSISTGLRENHANVTKGPENGVNKREAPETHAKNMVRLGRMLKEATTDEAMVILAEELIGGHSGAERIKRVQEWAVGAGDARIERSASNLLNGLQYIGKAERPYRTADGKRFASREAALQYLFKLHAGRSGRKDWIWIGTGQEPKWEVDIDSGTILEKSSRLAKESAIDAALRSVGIDPNAPPDKAKAMRREADKLMKESMKMLERIPPGQPLSSTRDRNLRDKARAKAEKAGELYRQAEEIERARGDDPYSTSSKALKSTLSSLVEKSNPSAIETLAMEMDVLEGMLGTV